MRNSKAKSLVRAGAAAAVGVLLAASGPWWARAVPAVVEGESGETVPQAGEAPHVELTDETYERWRDYVLPKPEELRWQQIPWRPSAGAALAEARAQAPGRQKPVLLWVMNGHPLANC